MTGAVIPILQQEAADQIRMRGRPNSYVVQAISPPPFATPVNIHPESNTAIPGGLPTNQPPPEPRYNSQSSMNRVYMSEVETPIRGSSFQENRDHFIRMFDQKRWNYPGEELQSIETQLYDSRALVIAIHYGGSDPLPATYVDALNITHVLVKFGYHPKCIRVLADQVDVRDRKDDRWPNKDNIVSGLKWLAEGTVPGCKRFLFFAGHGHRLVTSEEGVCFTREGILPKDFLTYTTRSGQEVPDPKTVLFDDELNQLLVKIGDGTRLTISWAACDGSQLAREDANTGGRFTSAFTDGIFKEEEGISQLTYRILNRRIQAEFDNHNKKANDVQDSAASASGQSPAIRASKTQNAIQKDENFQYPKLYVSNNIANIIADREIVL
ncbi:ICE-like protease (caspase) p20 domain protein [Rhizoctonia solani]|uniref:ICE-like protease (Caspase) p20 domain protein n=1 Tax=Rhizoctonia solani TaxID=456999 RepID=A0A8H8NUR2_9AGAM|nr:ICE-like protease (caspase) p20 domain protein [Rhizoctonia solani]QRW18542.1 ICE-like protease (caspase) p20 domain protein [Rhizoctonia solani]